MEGLPTGPDADVLIGPDFKPFYDSDKGKDLGVSSWPPDAWRQGGGTMWGWISYDPELNLIYHGTANPGPWNHEQRPGDNKWTAGIFARDADTGEARWFYQFTPHDLHDWDGINEIILLDMQWQGQPRKVLVRPERNGYLYVIDRTNGEVLSAEPYAYINSSSGVDLKTGRLRLNPEKEPKLNRRCAISVRPRQEQRTGIPLRTPAALGSSISPTTICAWTGKALMRTTSLARPMSEPR